jgi:hypothetical protein
MNFECFLIMLENDSVHMYVFTDQQSVIGDGFSVELCFTTMYESC